MMSVEKRSGFTPLIYAAQKNYRKACEVIINFLLNEEVSLGIDRATFTQWINMRDLGDGFTALHFASFYGNIKLIRFLVSHGANIHAVNKIGINMVHVAA